MVRVRRGSVRVCVLEGGVGVGWGGEGEQNGGEQGHLQAAACPASPLAECPRADAWQARRVQFSGMLPKACLPRVAVMAGSSRG